MDGIQGGIGGIAYAAPEKQDLTKTPTPTMPKPATAGQPYNATGQLAAMRRTGGVQTADRQSPWSVVRQEGVRQLPMPTGNRAATKQPMGQASGYRTNQQVMQERGWDNAAAYQNVGRGQGYTQQQWLTANPRTGVSPFQTWMRSRVPVQAAPATPVQAQPITSPPMFGGQGGMMSPMPQGDTWGVGLVGGPTPGANPMQQFGSQLPYLPQVAAQSPYGMSGGFNGQAPWMYPMGGVWY